MVVLLVTRLLPVVVVETVQTLTSVLLVLTTVMMLLSLVLIPTDRTLVHVETVTREVHALM